MAAYPPYNPYQYAPMYGQQAMYPQVYTPPPYQAQVQQAIQPAQPNVAVRMVMSREEAVAAQIPFDPTVNVFVNRAAGEVYIKMFNMNTGKADFEDYRLAMPAPVQAVQQVQQVPQQPVQTQTEYAPMTALRDLEARVNRISDALSGQGEERTVQAKKAATQRQGKDEQP